MKAIGWLAAIGLLASARQVVTFDAGPAGVPPPGWTIVETHRQPESRWEIRKDSTAPTQPNVLAQVSVSSEANRFPLAIFDRVSFQDGDLSVRIKPISGKVEQAAGLVWRYRDQGNYYLARINALEDNVAVYKVVDGHYIALKPRGTPPGTTNVQRRFAPQAWKILKVSARGRRFSVYVNHRRILETEDDTFSGLGKVGLWTRADSVFHFDDFRANPR